MAALRKTGTRSKRSTTAASTRSRAGPGAGLKAGGKRKTAARSKLK